MRTHQLIVLTLLAAILLSACRGVQYTTEYDDVYFTSADRANEVVKPRTPTATNYDAYDNDAQYSDVNRIDSYNDAYYAEDDFAFSRRLRRFNTSGRSAWRYYDPFYSNDLYYVMNTPSWDPWMQNGWYDWNQPRFGSVVSFNWGVNNYWGGANNFFYPYSYNNWSSYNYYNPWVSTYYSYDPWFGYSGYAGWGTWGYGNYWNGYYNGYNNGYCDGLGIGNSFTSWNRFRTAHRGTTTSLTGIGTGTGDNPRPQVGTNNTQPNTGRTYPGSVNPSQANASIDKTGTGRSVSYLTPKTDNEFGSPTRVNTPSKSNSSNTFSNPGRTTSKPVYSPTRPTTTSTPSRTTTTRPSRPSTTSPSRTTTTRPSRPSKNSPSRTTTTRPSRPSSSPSRTTTTRPSRPSTSSPSRSTSSPSRSTPSRRPR